MTRQKSSPKSRKRYRVAIAFAAVSCAAFALVGPRLIADIGADLSLADLSLEAVAVLAATRDSYRLTETFSLPFMPHLQIESGTVSIGTNGPQPETGTAVLAMLQSGKAHLVLDDASMSLDPSRMSSGGGSVAGPSEMLAPLLSALVSSSFSTLEVRGASVHLKTGRGA